MNQKKRENNIILYLQVLAFGLILVLSPCSVRNSLQDAFHLEKTGITNFSKTTKSNEDDCALVGIDVENFNSEELTNTTPSPFYFAKNRKTNFASVFPNSQDEAFGQYESPATVKSKTPLYLLNQQFKTYLTFENLIAV